MGFEVSGFGFWVSSFGSRVSDFGFEVSGSGFRLRAWGLGFGVSCLGFGVLGFGVQVYLARSLTPEKMIARRFPGHTNCAIHVVLRWLNVFYRPFPEQTSVFGDGRQAN